MRTFLLLIASWLVFAGTANAAVVSVTRTNDPDTDGVCAPVANRDCSLRQAIRYASSGDEILLLGDGAHAAVHTVTLGELRFSKRLTIQGGGPSATAIDAAYANNGERIMHVVDAEVTIQDLTFRHTQQTRDEITSNDPALHNGGGALYSEDATLALQNVVFEGATSPVMPGGALSIRYGTVSVLDADFHASYGHTGSAIYARNANVTIERSTVRNSSDTNRGSIFLTENANVTLRNSTVTRNGFGSHPGGGVINAGGTLTLLNSTFADNVGGSVMTYDGATTDAKNTIFGAGFLAACLPEDEPRFPEAGPPITHDLGFNFAPDASCGLDSPTSNSNANLPLAPVADNGGRTPTMAVLYLNQALDAGSNCEGEDQRRVPRTGLCDAGAFEASNFGEPSAATGDVVRIAHDEATVAADLNLAGEAGALTIELGQDVPVPYVTIGAGVVSQTTHREVTLPNLAPDTTYYYRAVATNATGRKTGETRSFKTLPQPPTVYAPQVSGSTDTTATFLTQINPNGRATTYKVKWASPGGDHGEIGPFDVGSGTDPVPFTRTITGLKPNTSYVITVAATNEGGTAAADTEPFTTAQQVAGEAGETVTLTDNGVASECPVQADITWGDRTPVEINRDITCTNTTGGRQYTLTARHTYGEPGHYAIHLSYPESAKDAYALITRTVRQTLSVERVGPGRVTGGAIDCGTTCTAQATSGETVTLTAAPDAGARFDGWEGACSGTAPTCALTLDADKAVVARFSAVQAQASPTPTPTATPAASPTPGATPTPEPPIPGKTVVVAPTGTVLVKLKGTNKFVPLQPGSLPLGAQIDATKGRVTITSIRKPGAPPETATFYGGIFTITQSGGVTVLKLSGPAPTCAKARAAAGQKVKARRLWGEGKGNFRTAGKYSAATVRGTRWLVEDNCSGTLTRVVSGVVSVRDNVRGKTIVLRAGKRYLAKPRGR